MILKYISKIYNLIKIKLKERRYKGVLNYLYYRKKSSTLIIVFSAFTGKKRRYNYVKGLADSKYDRLYILDPWGDRGSYNLFENGENYPEVYTSSLISEIITQNNYTTIITAGSSKGGTCSIYYGLKHGASKIIAGACQYNLGTYLHREDHEHIFKGMMGRDAGQKEADFLDSVMPLMLEQHANSQVVVYLLYSKAELTYQRQIIDLIKKLHECNITLKEKVESFEKHEDVGYYFLPYLKQIINE